MMEGQQKPVKSKKRPHFPKNKIFEFRKEKKLGILIGRGFLPTHSLGQKPNYWHFYKPAQYNGSHDDNIGFILL